MTDAYPPIEEAVAYPIVNPAFVPVTVDENTVHLRAGPWDGAKYTIDDDDEEGRLAAFVRALDGDTHVSDVLARFDAPGELEEFLRHLYRKNVVIDAADSAVDRRLHGHLTLSQETSRGDADRLRESSVLVVGGGRMAEGVAADLADAGVGEVTYGGVGERGRRPFEGDDRVTGSDADLDDLVAAADFAVAAVDHHRAALLDELNRTAVRTATPWMVGRVQGIDGQVGPLVVPGETSCYDCFRTRRLTNLDDPERFDGYERQGADSPGEPLGSFAPYGRVVGGYVALDAINYLASGYGLTAGRLMNVDLATFEVDVNEVLRLPRCDVCGIDEDETPEHDEYLTVQNLLDDLDVRGGDD